MSIIELTGMMIKIIISAILSVVSVIGIIGGMLIIGILILALLGMIIKKIQQRRR